MPYKIALTAVNVLSCYWAIFKYSRYFANRHPKIIEDECAVEVVLRLEEATDIGTTEALLSPSQGRRMTVTTIIATNSTFRDTLILSPQLPRN